MNAEEAARAWLDEMDAAYSDGGFAAGDNPEPPTEIVGALLAENTALRSALSDLLEAAESALMNLGQVQTSTPAPVAWAHHLLNEAVVAARTLMEDR